MSELWDDSYSDVLRELVQTHRDEYSTAYHLLNEVEERYSEFTPIAGGALKDVSSCYDNTAQRRVAYAKLKEGLRGKFVDLFIHEAWLTTALQHPNIIKVHDVGVASDGRPYYTMDLKANKSLKDFILTELELEVRLQAFLIICGAVSYAHGHGVLHLDLKPDNIQCDQYGEVLVCDWGLGKKIGDEEIVVHLEEVSVHTMHGDVKGTPGYMAPEQIHQEVEKSERTDIYALGAILHFILTQHAPFQGDELLAQTLQADMVSPGQNHPHLKISPSLDAVVTKAMRQDPADRYAEVSEMISDVQRYLSGRTTSVEAKNPLRSLFLLINRHKTVSLVTAVFTLALAIFSFVATDLVQRKRAEAEAAQGRVVVLSEERAEMIDQRELVDGVISKHHGLASKVISTASQIMSEAEVGNLGEYDTIVQAWTDAGILIDFCHNICPTHEALPVARLRYHLVQMSFKEIVNLESTTIDQSLRFSRYQDLALLRREYNFDQERRPSVEELLSFLREGSKLQVDRLLLFAIVRYDQECREIYDERYDEVYLSLIQGFNKSIELDLNTQDGVKSLTVGGGDRYNITTIYDVFSPLAELDVDEIVFTLERQHDFSFLNGSRCKTFDFSKCAAMNISSALDLPELTLVRYRKGTKVPEVFRRVLRTEQFERVNFLEIEDL